MWRQERWLVSVFESASLSVCQSVSESAASPTVLWTLSRGACSFAFEDLRPTATTSRRKPCDAVPRRWW